MGKARAKLELGSGLEAPARHLRSAPAAPSQTSKRARSTSLSQETLPHSQTPRPVGNASPAHVEKINDAVLVAQQVAARNAEHTNALPTRKNAVNKAKETISFEQAVALYPNHFKVIKKSEYRDYRSVPLNLLAEPALVVCTTCLARGHKAGKAYFHSTMAKGYHRHIARQHPTANLPGARTAPPVDNADVGPNLFSDHLGDEITFENYVLPYSILVSGASFEEVDELLRLLGPFISNTRLPPHLRATLPPSIFGEEQSMGAFCWYRPWGTPDLSRDDRHCERWTEEDVMQVFKDFREAEEEAEEETEE